MTVKHWLHGLMAAIVSGSASTVGAISGAAVSGTPMDFKAMGGAAIGGALTGAIFYLKQSPVPFDDVQKPPTTIANFPETK